MTRNGAVPSRSASTVIHHTTCPWCKADLWTAQTRSAVRRNTVYMNHVRRVHPDDIPNSRDRALMADVMLREEKLATVEKSYGR